MRISSVAFLALLLPGPVLAEVLTQEVPGHAGVTYADLMKLAIPDLAEQKDGSWKGANVPVLNDIGGKPTQNDISDGFGFGAVEVLKVKEGGKSRLLLLTSDSRADSFAEVLAVFDDEPPMPQLLDAADAGHDRLTSFGNATLKLDDGTDLFVIENMHSNSNQSYVEDALLFLKDGKLQQATSVLSFGERVCTHEMSETPEFKTVFDAHARYRAVVATVTQETVLTDLDCGSDGVKRPSAGKRIFRDVFHWDDKRGEFRSKTDVLGQLAKEDEKRY